jgi:hypothetical protein
VALVSRTATATNKSSKGKAPKSSPKDMKLREKAPVKTAGAAAKDKAKPVSRTARSSTVKVVANVDLSAFLPTTKHVNQRAPAKVIATTKRTGVKAVRARRSREVVAGDIAAAMMSEFMAGEDSALERQAAKSQRERDILGRLSAAMGRSDEVANFELAADIVFSEDGEAVSILIGAIERHDPMHVVDAARVLSEVGTRAPELVMLHIERLLSLVDSDHDDVLPYTMTAIAPVGTQVAESLWESRDMLWQPLSDLNQPCTFAQQGAVRLLASLCLAGPDYARTLAGGLVDLLGKCMPRDVAFFAEVVLPALGQAHSHRAKPVLERRLKELTPAEVARLRRAQRAAQLGNPMPFAA